MAAYSETLLANMSLARLGSKQLTNLATDTSVEAIHCRTHYEQTRDSLLRSHWWRFAQARATLTEDTDTPAFGWDYQYVLPDDFFRLMWVFQDNVPPENVTTYSYDIEGQRILSNQDTIQILYIKKVTDPTKFDPLFVEVLTLSLAIKLVMPLSQDKVLARELRDELEGLMSRVRTIDRQETNTVGSSDRGTWSNARLGDRRIDSKMGS